MFKKILVLVLFIGAFYGISYYQHNYTRENCKVVQSYNGIATIEDCTGNYWEYEDNNLQVGDCVDLKMFDNLSDTNIEDDIITKVVVK